MAEIDPRRPTVLCINGLQFARDIVELQNRGTRYNWGAIKDTYLVSKQDAWMPERLKDQSAYVNESGADVDAAWATSKGFGLGILDNFAKQGLNITAVLAANFDYWYDECLRLACDELGLPFLVLMREHDLTGMRFKTQGDYYGRMKRIPHITAMACAGEATREVYGDLNVIPHDKLRITGWPRHDVWRAPVSPAYDRPVILMSYHKGYGATEDFEEMMRRFAALARRYPQVPFLVKAKHALEVSTLR